MANPPWTAPVRVIVKTALAPSVTEISPIAKEAASLSAIVTVAVSFAPSIVVSASPDVIVFKVTITVSLVSRIVSSTTVTSIIADVLPAGIVTVPVKVV